jgi:hypothetical protein
VDATKERPEDDSLSVSIEERRLEDKEEYSIEFS